MERGEASPTPERSPEAASTRVTTTLFDVLAAFQTVVEPEENAVVVAMVAAWLRSGRLRFLEDVTTRRREEEHSGHGRAWVGFQTAIRVASCGCTS